MSTCLHARSYIVLFPREKSELFNWLDINVWNGWSLSAPSTSEYTSDWRNSKRVRFSSKRCCGKTETHKQREYSCHFSHLQSLVIDKTKWLLQWNSHLVFKQNLTMWLIEQWYQIISSKFVSSFSLLDCLIYH